MNTPQLSIRNRTATGIVALMSCVASSTLAQTSMKTLSQDTAQISKVAVETRPINNFFSFLKKDSQKSKCRKVVREFKSNYKSEYKAIKENRGKPFVTEGSFIIFPGKNKSQNGTVALNDDSTFIFSDWKNVSIVGTLKDDKVIISDSKKIKYLPLAGSDSTKIDSCLNINIRDAEGANFLDIGKNDSLVKVTNYSPGSTIVNNSDGAKIKVANSTVINNADAVVIDLKENNTVINGKEKYDLELEQINKNPKSAGSKSGELTYININGKNIKIWNYSKSAVIRGRNDTTKILVDRTPRQ